MFPRLFRRDPVVNIEVLYGAIVAQARVPAFYAEYGVPDTLAGRFDLLVLHLFLVARRLRRDDGAQHANRALFERFFADMDGNLREIGVGDLSVPREIRNMARAMFGRLERYEVALTHPDNSALTAALLRNVFSGATSAQAGAERLARYVRQAALQLASSTEESILSGGVRLPSPEGTR
jgi:cytochrome b pre-mRNA-processing protein 3